MGEAKALRKEGILKNITRTDICQGAVLMTANIPTSILTRTLKWIYGTVLRKVFRRL
jgi:hypothetical protein